MLYQLAEHPNFGDTFIDRGEEKLLARLGLEPAAECSTAKVGFFSCLPANRGFEGGWASFAPYIASLVCDVMTTNKRSRPSPEITGTAETSFRLFFFKS